MVDQGHLSRFEKRVARNIFHEFCSDGLVDMMFGVYFTLLGACLPHGGFIVFIILLMIFFPRLLLELKKRYVYPRTGYVELREGDPGPAPRIILLFAVLGLLAFVSVLAAAGVPAQPDQWYRWMPIPFGVWICGIFLGLGLAVKLSRYYVVSILSLVCGLFFALPQETRKLENIGLFLAAVGAVLSLWGAAAFVRFLRANPVGGAFDAAE